MCMIDDAEGPVTMLSTAAPRARKQHKCAECARRIEPGESYSVERFLFDGSLTTHKTCSHCLVARGWLYDECGGFMYGSVEEDIREHATGGGYPVGVLRLAVGMWWKWKAPSGRMLPVPKMPPTTHERAV
jgi:hypothetical protein